jgi:hypothetical protein
MSQTHISRELRERVAAQAQYRCGYCLTAEAIVGTPMEFDRLIPESLGGLTEESNLWLACSLWRPSCACAGPREAPRWGSAVRTASRVFNAGTGKLRGVLVAEDEQRIAVSFEGHYRAPAAESELVHVVQTRTSQDTVHAESICG